MSDAIPPVYSGTRVLRSLKGNYTGAGYFQPGGPPGNVNGLSREIAAALKIARQNSPAAIRKIAWLMTTSQDERVVLAAAIAILDRGMGKPGIIVDSQGGPVTVQVSWAPAELPASKS